MAKRTAWAAFSRCVAISAFVCGVLVLAGCSSRKAPPATPVAATDTEGGYLKSTSKALSERERAILNSARGPIVRSVPPSGMPAIEAQYAYYVKGAGRKTIKASSKRAEKYLSYARRTFKERGLPEELVYIAMVESGFNPKARSWAGAAGAWQFVPFTGMKYGLNQDKWKDERLDFYKSAHAAASYFEKLYGQFGDWPTAIAAYNAGEGKLDRACKASGESSFFGVCRKNNSLPPKLKLAKETRDYVPRFIAMSVIMENLEGLGFSPIHPERAVQPGSVDVPPRTNLQEMASACGMSWGEFSSYNPHCLAKISSPGSVSTVYFPPRVRDAAVAYAQNPTICTPSFASNAVPKSPVAVARGSSKPTTPTKGGKTGSSPANASRYRLQKGETLYSVAKSRGVDVKDLLAANNLRDAKSVKAGTVLIIPAPKQARSASRAGAKTAQKKGGGKKGTTYTVQPNDNLWRISRKFSVSVEDLQRWNGMGNGQNLSVGQTIFVQAR